MKYRIISIAFFTLFLSACEKEYYTGAIPELVPPSVPAGGVANSAILSENENSITIEVDFYIVDGFGGVIKSLDIDDIYIEIFDSISLINTRIVTIDSEDKGEYSALTLYDDSGSIASTDPNDDRIKAGIAMVDLLVGNEEMCVTRFTTSLRDRYEIMVPFTKNKNELKAGIEILSLGESGNTPLYFSMFEMLNYIDDNAGNSNHALIAFTDGKDNVGNVSITSIIARANRLNIPIYTIGLGLGTNLDELAAIAFQTGGAIMLADNAKQLIALYSSLSELLRGNIDLFRLTAEIDKSSFRFGNLNNAFLVVTLPSGEIVRLPVRFG
ncbi:MAG: vWA domain-containing protein [Saprospiraceae bacterium]